MKKKVKRKLTKAKQKLQTLERENKELFEQIENLKPPREIRDEMQRRRAAFGEENHKPVMWAAILQEATGRLATQAILTEYKDKDASQPKMRHAVIQCSAIMILLLKCIDDGRLS